MPTLNVLDPVAKDLQYFDGWKVNIAGLLPMVEVAMEIDTECELRPEDLHADVFF